MRRQLFQLPGGREGGREEGEEGARPVAMRAERFSKSPRHEAPGLDVLLQSTYVGTRKYLDELTAEATRRVHSVVRNARIMNGT